MSENLLLGLEDTTTKQLLEACDRAGLLETVRQLPKGLDTEVGSGKHMLSGGQLRRMAIARALLRRPAVLLLDEPTTGLDVQNSSLVLNTLRRISDRTTVVMVSHRSEPLKASDHHLILQDGGWTASAVHQGPRAEAGEVAAAGAATNDAQPSAATNRAATSSPAMAEFSPADVGRINGTTTNGTSANGMAANGVASHGLDANGTASPTNGADASRGLDQLLRHQEVDQRVLALSAMGRPIVLAGIDSAQASTRVLLISGHRSLATPITGIADAVFAQVVADDQALVALANIEDVNPDGAFSSRRETVLGIDVETDHRSCKAAETRALHGALTAWRTTIVIDVAARTTTVESPHHVEIGVRFRPDADGNPSPEVAAFARDIRARIDSSTFAYRVTMVGAVPGSLTATKGMPVVELTAHNDSDPSVVQAMIEATAATYRAADAAAQLVSA